MCSTLHEWEGKFFKMHYFIDVFISFVVTINSSGYIICFSRIKLIFKTSEDHTIAKLKSTSETSRKCLTWPYTNFPFSLRTSNKGAFLGIQ